MEDGGGRVEAQPIIQNASDEELAPVALGVENGTPSSEGLSPLGAVNGEAGLVDAVPVREEKPEEQTDLLRQQIVATELNGSLSVKGATFERLATWAASQNTDPKLSKAFLMCYRSFGSPTDLFNVLLKLYGYVPEAGNTFVPSPPKLNRLNAFLFEWVDSHFFEDFFKKPLYSQILDFAKNSKTLSKDDSSKLKLLFIQKPKQKPAKGRPAPVPPIRPPETFKSIDIVEVSAAAIAEQLTLIDFKQFGGIKAKEFLNLAWTKSNKEDLSPHLLAYCRRFNQVSWWVATQVVEASDKKRQQHLIKKFIMIADKCYALGNFNSLMAIISGLNNFSIQRLRKAWEMLAVKTREVFDKLERVMAPQKNFHRYRLELEKRAPPLIPYMAMYLRDITFIYDGNTDHIDENKTLINFEKFELVAALLSEIEKYQGTPYDIPVDDTLHAYLLNVTFLDEDALHKQSLECEPPAGGVNSSADEGARTSIFDATGKLTKEPVNWTVADVQEWLESKGMAEYRENFLSKQIDGAQIIELDNRTLLALGVDHLVHRKKLLKDIMALHTIDFNNYEGKGEDKEGWRSKEPQSWTAEEVCYWLDSLGMGEYRRNFMENQVAGAELLDLANDDLVALKIVRLGHRKRLIKFISELSVSKHKRSAGESGDAEDVAQEDGSDDESTRSRTWDGQNFADALIDEAISGESSDDDDFALRKPSKGKAIGRNGLALEDLQERLRSRAIEEEDEDEDNEPAAPGAETAGVTIKCYYESDIRTINIPRDVPLRDLRMIIAKTYGLKNDNFLIKYKDLEDDRITIRTEDDLRFALLLGMSAVKKLFIYHT